MKRSLSLTADEESDDNKRLRICLEPSFCPEKRRFLVFTTPEAFESMLPELWTVVFGFGLLKNWNGYENRLLLKFCPWLELPDFVFEEFSYAGT